MQVAYRNLKGHLYPENKTIKPFKKTKPGEIEVKQCVLTTVRTLQTFPRRGGSIYIFVSKPIFHLLQPQPKDDSLDEAICLHVGHSVCLQSSEFCHLVKGLFFLCLLSSVGLLFCCCASVLAFTHFDELVILKFQ